jgi:hypothetical protein
LLCRHRLQPVRLGARILGLRCHRVRFGLFSLDLSGPLGCLYPDLLSASAAGAGALIHHEKHDNGHDD